jgi:hypothetical protein
MAVIVAPRIRMDPHNHVKLSASRYFVIMKSCGSGFDRKRALLYQRMCQNPQSYTESEYIPCIQEGTFEDILKYDCDTINSQFEDQPYIYTLKTYQFENDHVTYYVEDVWKDPIRDGVVHIVYNIKTWSL